VLKSDAKQEEEG